MTDDEMINCSEKSAQTQRLRAIMHRLRAPGGCPWDAEQTHQSIIPNLIEEAYETVDTIQRSDYDHLREELGDLLLQVIFHSEIAEETGRFNFDDVAQGICDKLVRRHPHVFADSDVSDTSGVLNQWENIKRAEKGTDSKPYLHNTGKGLPGLLRAAKLQKKAAKVGFDWPDAAGIIEKIHEELNEAQEEIAALTNPAIPSDALEAEIGDVLFIVTNLARKLNIDPEAALERTNNKFERRFAYVEQQLLSKGLALEAANIDAMEAHWLEAKTVVDGGKRQVIR